MWIWALWIFPLLCKLSLTALPTKPENISCVLYNYKTLTCTWSPEKETNFTQYIVNVICKSGKSYTCTSSSSTGASCSFLGEIIPPPNNCDIEVEAQNADGIIKSDITHWRLNDIVKTIPPEILSVKPVLGIKKMLQIRWKSRLSSNLKYILRFKTVNSTHWVEVNFSDVKIYNLTGLQASTEYVIALCCKTYSSRIWSDWSQEKRGITEEEVPHVLDLWRILRPVAVDGSRPVRLLWKKAKGAPVLEKTFGYNIKYSPENNTNVTEIRTTNHTLDLHFGGETYHVSVTSYNSLGNSIAATLRIPDVHEKPFPCIKAVKARLDEDQLVVEWPCSCLEVDTWMVEWFPDLDSELSAFSWEPVSQAKKWTIPQDKLTPLSCYNISVYPVLQGQVGEPCSIQAYAKEGIPSKGPLTKVENIGVKTVTVTWEEIPKEKRNGFISNYTIFYQAEGGQEFSKIVNSNILQYDLESLTRKTSYTVRVMASTVAGGIRGPRINFKTLSMSLFEILSMSCLVGGGFFMLIIFTVVSDFKKQNSKLAHLCWPDVPNPAESSIATWLGADFKGKVHLKEFDDSVNTEDKTLKPCSAPSDLIDKLVVNFGNFLEEASIEEAGRSQENILGVEKNEYVTAPYRSNFPPGKNFEGPLVLTEIPSRKSQHLYLGMAEEFSETREELPSSGQSSGTDHLCGDRAPNPYLKNSVTTREFLTLEKLPYHTKKEV
ncbi:PREDICTED: interleukin-31 receptor subunit alpha [Chinchilla lanigera]|uniref:Interleukin-31 receptor subunit alpha n=1 Tax=Chinchilla lanigera TaxID=34839 RepID=A0A8C2YMJ9_CHILA|nr:PREDICTED: interleukin-31 receptor subunit alpha [Chinchilla lanigera]XP_005392748.1 PREDICTED: interleukin-31 receptor subunit alpha [Chinchilla lanigera]XP_013373922.1 PREDICTED: interleukin-31 receptor subunit alpha [Chinchilla lanigera]